MSLTNDQEKCFYNCLCCKNSKCIDCCFCLFILLACSLSIGMLTYLISGIIIVVNDYHYSDDCDGSYLAIYVIIGLALVLKFFVNSKAESNEKSKKTTLILVILLICQFLIDLGLSIWGGFELFNIPSDCNELRDSNLWKLGLSTFILQVVMASIVIICLIVIACSKMNNNRVTDIETGQNNVNN